MIGHSLLDYLAVSALTLTLCDITDNLVDEIRYVWSGGRGWTKWLYVFIRYFSLMPIVVCLVIRDLPQATCRPWVIVQGIGLITLQCTVNIILICRLYALFYLNRTVLWILVALLVVDVALEAIFSIISILQFSFSDEGCNVISSPRVFIISWLSGLAYATTVFAFSLVAFVRSYSLSKRLGRKSVIFVIMRDGTWVYACAFGILLLNLITYQTIHSALAGIFFASSISLLSSAGSHMVLNLKKWAERQGIRNVTLTSVTDIRFAPASLRTSTQDIIRSS